MAAYHAGQIVNVDWREGELKPTRAIVVEDVELFATSYPNIILVPLTPNARLAIGELSTPIAPTPENGCAGACVALSHCVATTAVTRVSATEGSITPEQLGRIRRQIAVSIGLG